MITDPIADMLTRIRNADMAGHTKVNFPASRIKAGICSVLKEEGFIVSFKIVNKKDTHLQISVKLKKSAIVGVNRVSKPGLRKYSGFRNVPRVLSGLGISVLSTSKGIISSRKAKRLKLGGEILCNVW